MPRYDYECPTGHVSEQVFAMSGTIPEHVDCDCGMRARRVFSMPAIQFHGRSSFTDAVTRRRRRPNAGDDLPRQHDPDADAIAKSV